MANPRISMRKIKDVLRLRYEAGLSYRQIARARVRSCLHTAMRFINHRQR